MQVTNNFYAFNLCFFLDDINTVMSATLCQTDFFATEFPM